MTVITEGVVPRFAVQAPAVPPLRSGLLAVAGITDTNNPYSGVDYLTGPCGVAGLAPGLCLPNTDVPVDEVKQVQYPEVVEGGPFGVYRIVGCNIAGEPWQQMAVDSFNRGEPAAVESAVYHILLQHATVIPGGDVPQGAPGALGGLEQVMAENYSGQPTILTSRIGATVLSAQGIAFTSANQLSTVLGTPIGALSFGQFAPGGSQAPEGSFWIFATGHIHLWRGNTFVSDPIRDVTTNDSAVLVERVWSVTVECGVYAALASLCAC